MKSNAKKAGLMVTTTIGGVLTAMLGMSLATAAAAQDTPSAAPAEVIVTGSRIRKLNNVAISPVSSVGASDIAATGLSRIEDVINSLPQAFASQGGNISNGASGTATVNLRGLGSDRTLVLINGRRLGPGTAGDSAADLNFIPDALIRRIDIVTGGGSAVYGSDALAGVVNFVMDTNFTGLKLEYTSSAYMHKNDNSELQALNKSRGFDVPKENVTDGRTEDFSIVMGTGTEDGKGHITAYANYVSTDAILQAGRDYSACTLNSGDLFTCGGSGTAYPARIGSFQVAGNKGSQTLVARNPAYVYNFGPTNYFQRPVERFSLGAFGNYKVNDHAEAYTELMFMDYNSTAQIAPGGIFAGNQTLNCDNAYASAQQLTALCGADANTAATRTVTVARRNVEGGGRQSVFTNTDYRLVGGVKGEIAQGWDYDASVTFYSVTSTQDTLNYFLTPNIAKALIAKKNAAGEIVCGVNAVEVTDAACVPYDLWSANGVTSAMLNYLQAPSSAKSNLTQKIFNVSVSGDLGQYGIKSPWAADGVGVAFGFEQRDDKASYRADYLAKQGLLSGSGGASPDVDGATSVKEIFVEAKVPLLQDLPFAKSVGLELGYRDTKFSKAESFGNYKAGVDWSPIQELRIRASYQRATRAPNINELYSPQNVTLDGTTDPCSGTAAELAANGVTAAMCARTGVTAAQFGNIENNPAAQYNGLGGGNPLLKPEISDTNSLGFVAQPSFIKNLTVSLDYFDIRVRQFIGGVGADLAVNRCLDTGEAYFCNLIHRDTQGSLWLSNSGYITNTLLNTGSVRTTGIDVNVDYTADYGSFGKVNYSLVGTKVEKLSTQPLPKDASYNCVGYYGTICGTPNPEWRHTAKIIWDTPFYGIEVTGKWRYFGEVKVDGLSDDPQLNNPGQVLKTDAKLEAQNYLDLSASMPFAKYYTLRVGANNLLDESPPLFGSANCVAGPCNGNTMAQVYDSTGRYVYATITAKF